MHDERPGEPERSPPPEPRDDEPAPIVERPRDAPPIDPFSHLAPPSAPRGAESDDDDWEVDGAGGEGDHGDELELDDEPTELVMIRTYANPVEVDIARLALEAAGIPSVVSTDTSLTMPFMIIASGIRLYVPDWAVEDAEEALREEEDEEPR